MRAPSAVQLFDSWAGSAVARRVRAVRAAAQPRGARAAGRAGAAHPLRGGDGRVARLDARGRCRRRRRRLAGAARRGRPPTRPGRGRAGQPRPGAPARRLAGGRGRGAPHRRPRDAPRPGTSSTSGTACRRTPTRTCSPASSRSSTSCDASPSSAAGSRGSRPHGRWPRPAPTSSCSRPRRAVGGKLRVATVAGRAGRRRCRGDAGPPSRRRRSCSRELGLSRSRR